MDPRDQESVHASALTLERPTDWPTERPAAKPRNPSLGLSIEPTFCPAGVADPFETVKWEQRTAAIKGEGGEVIFEQNGLRNPGLLEPTGDQCRGQQVFLRRERHLGARAERPPARPSRQPHDRRLGPAGRLLRPAADAENFYRDLSWLCVQQYASFNSPVWFNVGLYHQYGIKGAMCNWHWDVAAEQGRSAGKPLRVSASLRLLHPERAGQHGRHHGACPQRGDALQVRLRHRHGPEHASLAPREAFRRRQALGSCRSCGSTTRSPPW